MPPDRFARRARILAAMLLASVAHCTAYSTQTDGVPTPVCTDFSQAGACSWSAPEPGIGSGPRGFTAPGVVDGNRLIVAIEGGLVAIDLHTGDRQLLTGSVDEGGQTLTAGSGPESISTVEVLRIGPDRAYYVAGPDDAITRVDPSTGQRSVALSPNEVQCDIDGLHLVPRPSNGFDFGDDGSLYVIGDWTAASSAGNATFAVGLASIAGDTCTPISVVFSGATRPNIGDGPEWSVDLNSLTFTNGALWLVDAAADSLFRVDAIDGARTRVSGHDDEYQTGDPYDPPSLHAASIISDGAWYAAGGADETAARIDLATGARTPITWTGPFAPGSFGGVGAVVSDPTRPLLYAFSNGIVVINKITGRSSWLSF